MGSGIFPVGYKPFVRGFQALNYIRPTRSSTRPSPESAGGSDPGETLGSELQRLNFLRRVGDHAGHVFHCLRSESEKERGC